jgi:hypothetical protein
MNKYRNKIVVYEGIKFRSIHECNYYKQLQLQMHSIQPEHKVVDIKRQVPYHLCVGDQKICRYDLDFLVTYADGHVEWVDAKGVRTELYKVKAKLMKAIFGITIKEV